MIRKRKLLTLSVILLALFILTTNYILNILSETENEVKNRAGIHEKIYYELSKLPERLKVASDPNENLEELIKNIYVVNRSLSFEKTWKIANSWVSQNQIVDFQSPLIGTVLNSLQNAEIIKADLDTRGTQLKFLLTLEGKQDVVFKPMWYEKEKIIEGPVYAGKDRYGSEIIAFYLSALLNIPFTPCSAERIVSLSHDLLPVATKQLLNTSFNIANRTCIYGKCFYCKKQDPICENQDLELPGAVIFNINGQMKHHRSPWQRTYKKNKKALWEESDNNYCEYVKEKLTSKRLLDLIDASIFDFLIQNGDRHHYETLHGNVILLDNGKGFGNPHFHHLDILAPFYQCCLMRTSTLKKLQRLSGGTLKKTLERLPQVKNFITEAHLKAMEDRLLLIFATLEYCRHRNKLERSP